MKYIEAIQEQLTKVGLIIWSFMLRWADVFWLLPIAAFLFVTADTWIRFIDPTSPVMSVEFVSILNFNILKWLAVMIGTYVIARIQFKFDIFEEGWQERYFKKCPWAGAVLSFAIWLSVLVVTWFILTDDL